MPQYQELETIIEVQTTEFLDQQQPEWWDITFSTLPNPLLSLSRNVKRVVGHAFEVALQFSH
jgi:hypothetical protein